MLNYQPEVRNNQILNPLPEVRSSQQSPLSEVRSSQQSISKLPHLTLKNYTSINELDPTIQQTINRAADFRQSGNQINQPYQTTTHIVQSGITFGN